MKHALALIFSVAAAAASAEDCGHPPVTKATNAICLAKRFVKQPSDWELAFEAKELPNEWLVSYAPTDSNVRGGAGDLKVEKASGKITVVKLYR